MNFIPILVSVFWNETRASLSMILSSVGANSTTVTSDPRRRHTEPSSRPMTPPPMTTIVLGTSVVGEGSVSTAAPVVERTGTADAPFSASAPVEDTTRDSSMVTPGSGVTCAEQDVSGERRRRAVARARGVRASEPAANRMFLARSVLVVPSAAVTTTSPLVAVSFAAPFT